MTIHHFTARALWRKSPLVCREACAYLWACFRREFPRTLGCVLMPDHFHLLQETARPDAVRTAIGRILSGFTRRFYPGTEVWAPVSPPTLIPDLHHLKRQARYVHLNPCRRGLVQDPLAWEWSTHREAVGAAASDWLDKKLLAQALQTGDRSFARVFHQYVSGDPTVHVLGTPLPRVFQPSELIVPGPALIKAVSQASRGLDDERAVRRGAVLFGKEMGIQRLDGLARACGVSVRTVRNVLNEAKGAQGGQMSEREARLLKATTMLLSAPERFGIR
jgi:REP element-mobilizing transposase RayT